MPRGDQVARLYTLVRDLARSKHGLTADVLAKRHDLNRRTVYRDFQALEAAGFPITSGGGRWKLVDGWENRIPFPLPLGELLALQLARDFLQPIRGTPLTRQFDSLYRRLTGSSGAQGELFPRLEAVFAARSQLAIDYSAHAAVIETLRRACEGRATVRAVYYAESRGEWTRRDVDPYMLYFDPHLEALYLFAWCHLRRAMRTFAVHRFRQVTMTARRFVAPEGFTPKGYLKGAFRIWRGENAINVRIAIDKDAAGWVTERHWHASQKVKRRSDGGCELSLTVDGTREIQRFILQLGAQAEVLEPVWLRREIADQQLRAARRNRVVADENVTLDDTGMRHSRGGS